MNEREKRQQEIDRLYKSARGLVKAEEAWSDVEPEPRENQRRERALKDLQNARTLLRKTAERWVRYEGQRKLKQASA